MALGVLGMAVGKWYLVGRKKTAQGSKGVVVG